MKLGTLFLKKEMRSEGGLSGLVDLLEISIAFFGRGTLPLVVCVCVPGVLFSTSELCVKAHAEHHAGQ